MRVPQIIAVQVVSAGAADLGNLIVQIKIDPGYRNAYFICLPKTDKAGKSEIRRDDFKGQYEDHFEIGLMDYAGALNQQGPMVEVSLFDDTWVRENKHLALTWPLLTHQKRNWSSRQAHYDHMVSSNNRAFQCRPIKVDLHETSTIQLPVVRRA